MPEPARVVLFVDYQNCYHLARDAFFAPGAFHANGQVDPRLLGELLTSLTPGGQARELVEVRIYTGRPSSSKDPRAYGAHMRQCATWEKKQKVRVVPRTLRYPRDWPRTRAEEKGIDVQLAIDFVMMRVRGEYDIGVIFSSDTDLLPALEAVCEIAQRDGTARPEVAAWGEPATGRSRLRVRGFDIHCHWLSRTSFDRVADPTDYNLRP